MAIDTTTSFSATPFTNWNDPKFEWFLQNQWMFLVINSTLKVLVAFLCILLNLYLIVCLIGVRELRNVSRFPLFPPLLLLSLVQIIYGSIGNFIYTLASICFYIDDTLLNTATHVLSVSPPLNLTSEEVQQFSHQFHLQGQVATSVRNWMLQNFDSSDICWLYILRVMINRDFSGVFIVAIATEHVIGVFYPYRVQNLRCFAYKRLALYSFLVLAATSSIFCCVVFGHKSVGHKYDTVSSSLFCSHYLLSSEEAHNLMETILFYILPAFISLLLYLAILTRLLKVEKREDEMSVITRCTLASMASCILWILLWFPKVIFNMYNNYLFDPNSNNSEVITTYQDHVYITNRSKIYYMWVHLELWDTLILLFSVSCPLTLIVFLKELRRPCEWITLRFEKETYDLSDVTNEDYLNEARRMSVDIELRLQRCSVAAFD